MKNIIRLTFLLIFVLLIAACGDKDTGNGEGNDNTNNAKPNNEVEQPYGNCV